MVVRSEVPSSIDIEYSKEKNLDVVYCLMRVLYISSEWDLCPFLKRQVDYLTAHGFHVDVYTFRGAKSLFRYSGAWFDLRRTFDISEYDVIHANFGQSALLAVPFKRPLVVTFHGSDLLGIRNENGKNTLKGLFLQTISRRIARAAAKVCIVSSRMAGFLPRDVKYEILPVGVDLEIFKPLSAIKCRNDLGLPLSRKLVLFGGRPERPDKRLWLAKRAVDEISEKHNAELVCMPSIPHELVPIYINACDVVLLTSMKEGSPNIIKEALACNVPVVSVDVGDVGNRIEGLKNCFISESDSPRHIADALEKSLTFDNDFQGRAFVSHLSEDIINNRLIDIYKAAAGVSGDGKFLSQNILTELKNG